MQREGAVPDSFVQKKCHAHRIFRLNKALSTKHLELLVRAALKSVFELCSLIASRSFPAPPNCAFFFRPFRFFFSPVFVFDHFAGLALPAPHSGWSTPMPHRSLFYLQLPPPCSPPPLPPPSHCLTTSLCLRLQPFPTLPANKPPNHTRLFYSSDPAHE